MKRQLISLVLAALTSAAARAELVEQTLTYEQNGAILEGYHVYDDAVTGKRPGVLVIHQWMGLSDYEKRRSRMLAELGYNVFAADVYGMGVRPRNTEEAGKLAERYKSDRKLYRERLLAALEILKAEEHTHPDKIAAIGYCFGGTGALELARAGTPIAGVVSFHGGLSTEPGFTAKTGEIPPKILVLHGADDPYVTPEELSAFEKEMTDARADWQLVKYCDAVHAFTQPEAGDDPTKGAAYNATADRRSWEAMKTFFAEIFSAK